MEKENTLRMNLSAPNFINVCIDEAANGGLGGRMYHYYKEEPARFGSVLELLGLAEKLYDGIAFPQASTMSRSFGKQEKEQPPYNRPRPGKLTGVRELTGHRGRLSTVLVRVDYRQNSTWQRIRGRMSRIPKRLRQKREKQPRKKLRMRLPDRAKRARPQSSRKQQPDQAKRARPRNSRKQARKKNSLPRSLPQRRKRKSWSPSQS